MAEHTPGPMEVREIKYFGYEIVRDGQIVATSLTKEEAHLLAAAPELLEALADVLEALEQGWPIHEDGLSVIRGAIAKARGENHG